METREGAPTSASHVVDIRQAETCPIWDHSLDLLPTSLTRSGPWVSMWRALTKTWSSNINVSPGITEGKDACLPCWSWRATITPSGQGTNLPGHGDQHSPAAAATFPGRGKARLVLIEHMMVDSVPCVQDLSR